MHLINVDTLELEYFVSDPPPYAILSHTWGNEELTFADITSSDAESSKQKAGYRKIKLTCDQARKDKVQYAWIDTCCINKDSSAELSEAINSMYQWYGNSEFCYAYLEDAAPPSDRGMLRDSLEKCKWLTRGWTLQELLAPSEVIFYGSEWSELGRKTEICDILHNVTGIPQDVLRKERPFEDISVAARMSWAATRQTKRKEDLAYCLIGIFDVNMPLLYGEGGKAFIRLQEEIMNQVQDDTLFAWCSDADSASQYPYRGLFASSPRDFRGCADLMHFGEDDTGTTRLIGNGKVSLRCTVQKEDDGFVLGLRCSRGDISKRKGIKVIRVGLSGCYRQSPSQLADCSSQLLEDIVMDKYILREKVDIPDNIHLRDAIYLDHLPMGVHLNAVHPTEAYDSTERTVSVIHTLHKKVAFELEFDRNILGDIMLPQVRGKNAKLLIVFWVEQDSGVRSYSYYLEVVPVSLDIQEHLANAIKPQNTFHNGRKVIFDWTQVYIFANHGHIKGRMLSLRLHCKADQAIRAVFREGQQLEAQQKREGLVMDFSAAMVAIYGVASHYSRTEILYDKVVVTSLLVVYLSLKYSISRSPANQCVRSLETQLSLLQRTS